MRERSRSADRGDRVGNRQAPIVARNPSCPGAPPVFAARVNVWTQCVVLVALLAQWLERAAVNRKVTGSIPVGSAHFSLRMRARLRRSPTRPRAWHCVRVVKESDLNSDGLCPHRFEPCRCRFLLSGGRLTGRGIHFDEQQPLSDSMAERSKAPA